MYREQKELITTSYAHPCLPKWRARIDAAERRGEFTEDDEDAALLWDSCAVGEAHETYGVPYGHSDGDAFCVFPVDPTLQVLGTNFSDCVCENDFTGCRDIIRGIEQRLRELA